MGVEYARNSSQSKSSSSPWVKSHRLGSESSSNVHPAAEKENRDEGVYDQFEPISTFVSSQCSPQ